MEKILVIRKNLEKVLYGLHKRSEKTWFIKRGTYPNTSQLMSREHFPSISDAILIHLTSFR